MLGIAFDMDGTLLDLPVDIESARAEIGELFASYGYHEPMRPILDAINRAAATVAKSDEEIFPLIIKARAILDSAELAATAKATPRPFAAEAIQVCKREKIPLGLVTNNSRACLMEALRSIGCQPRDFFISTRDDVRRPKPSPEGLVRIAPSLGKIGDDLWLIGDSPVDVSAAVAANPQVPQKVRAMAVPGPRSNAEQLLAAGPCVIAESLEDAMTQLLRKPA